MNRLIENERDREREMRNMHKQLEQMQEKIDELQEMVEEYDSRIWDIEREEYATLYDIQELNLMEFVDQDFITEIIREIGVSLSTY